MREEVFYSKLTEDNKSVKEYTTHRAELLSMYEIVTQEWRQR